MTSVVVSDAVYIPIRLIDDVQRVKENYTTNVYNEKACERCENLENRHDEVCETCPNFTARVKLWQYSKDKKSIGLPIGDKRNILRKTGVAPKYLYDRKYVNDKRVAPRMRSKISFTADLREYQTKPVTKWQEAGYGILKAPPRTGKTVMCVNIVCSMGLRTIILTNQEDLLKQFLKTFDEMTDHKDVAFMKKRPVVGIVEKLSDLETLDVALCTYQKFIRAKGKKYLRTKASKQFGLVFVDEGHRAAAKEFSGVVNKFWAKHRGALTATVERKDGMHFVVKQVIGPVVAKSFRKAMKPMLFFQKLPTEPKKGTAKTWTGGISWLSKDSKRNKAIAKYAARLIKDGRHILITAVRVEHCELLAKLINKELGETVVLPFHGKTRDREEVLKKATSGKRVKGIVGMRSIIATGINVPIWDTLLEISPLSNQPNHYQEIMRVCTESPGKPTPWIIHFASGWGPEAGCLRTCMKEYVKHCKVPKATYAEINGYLARKGKVVEDETASYRRLK